MLPIPRCILHMLRQEQYRESPEGRGCRPKVMQTWKAKVWSRLPGLVGAWLPQLLANFVQVDYFMRKRIIDKRKELMYAQGPAVQPNRGVGQIVSKWASRSDNHGQRDAILGWWAGVIAEISIGMKVVQYTRQGEAYLFKTVTKRREDIYFINGLSPPPVFVSPYLEASII